VRLVHGSLRVDRRGVRLDRGGVGIDRPSLRFDRAFPCVLPPLPCSMTNERGSRTRPGAATRSPSRPTPCD
jgi:hypothetical protein